MDNPSSLSIPISSLFEPSYSTMGLCTAPELGPPLSVPSCPESPGMKEQLPCHPSARLRDPRVEPACVGTPSGPRRRWSGGWGEERRAPDILPPPGPTQHPLCFLLPYRGFCPTKSRGICQIVTTAQSSTYCVPARGGLCSHCRPPHASECRRPSARGPVPAFRPGVEHCDTGRGQERPATRVALHAALGS